MNPKFRTATKNLLASLDDFSQSLPAVTWWRDRLQDVLDGKRNYASDPQGYMIIGTAGNADRGTSFVWRQWKYVLVEGLTTKAHIVLRGLKAKGSLESSLKAIEQGVYWSAPRQDGAYGTVEARNAAMQLSATVQHGGNIQHLLKRLQTAVVSGDVAFVQKELAEIKSLGIANDRLQAWIKQVESALPEQATAEPDTAESDTAETVSPEPATQETVSPEPATQETVSPEPATQETVSPVKITRKRGKKTA